MLVQNISLLLDSVLEDLVQQIRVSESEVSTEFAERDMKKNMVRHVDVPETLPN